MADDVADATHDVVADETTRRPTGRDEVVASLIAAARQLFSERGIEKVSVRQIAEAAGVNPGLLHRHFDGKQALVKACFAEDAVAARLALEVDRPDIAARALFDQALQRPAFVKILASALLGSVGPETVLPPDGPLRRYRDVLLETRDDDDVIVDFLLTTAAGLGWVLFGPALEFLAGDGVPDREQVERRLADRFASIASGSLADDGPA